MERLEQQIKAQNESILALNQKIDRIQTGKEMEIGEFGRLEPSTPHKEKSSSGNEGVYSFIHSFNIHSLNTYSFNMHSFKQDLEKVFSTLTKQEFLTFLTIYQLEEDFKRYVTYLDLSHKLRLSEGCIRTYVSNLLKKKVPLTKAKMNNRTAVLTIPKEFRELNLKQKLLSLFNKTDPEQTRLP